MGLVTRRVGYLALLAVEPAPLHTATLGMTPVATVIRESAESLERPSGVPPPPTSRTANLQSATRRIGNYLGLPHPAFRDTVFLSFAHEPLKSGRFRADAVDQRATASCCERNLPTKAT
jgi:hypothetical protein